ncbi:MAG: pyrroline-5-carboxylate reductase [Burkholderiales bacterium]|nr:pyrroline-5-carboxylate reductase [Burkholderiales bacterium]
MNKVCFVGGGNMANAMLSGLRRQQPTLTCHVIEPFAAAREHLASLGVTVHESACRDAVQGADAVVLAVKPQVLREACAALRPHLAGELIVSIAAGARIASIARWLGADSGAARIVRTMPNTPALIGQGITGLYAPEAMAEADVATATALMRSTGAVVRVTDEAMIDAVTAVSGSGPAYVFHWIESMLAAAKGVGFDDADARTLVLATLKGATALAEASDESPAVLRERVTSKGGTTAAALAVIEARGVREALIDAVRAARDRGAELGALTDGD